MRRVARFLVKKGMSFLIFMCPAGVLNFSLLRIVRRDLSLNTGIAHAEGVAGRSFPRLRARTLQDALAGRDFSLQTKEDRKTPNMHLKALEARGRIYPFA